MPFEGVQQRLLNYLDPVSYGDDLSRHLARFIGREWVMTEVEEWLATSRRVFNGYGRPTAISELVTCLAGARGKTGS